tara:strand:- start:2352 stop:2609 length:258 start_codon:yes stop_codon:yes gene_type:complete
MSKVSKIENVKDFLKIPDDKIDSCLKDFKAYIGIGKELIDMANLLGDMLGTDNPVNEEESLNVFEWIDDGKNDVTIVLNPNDEVE